MPFQPKMHFEIIKHDQFTKLLNSGMLFTKDVLSNKNFKYIWNYQDLKKVLYMSTINDLSEIDVSFDFTSDSAGYWSNFWNNNGGLGAGNCDPDTSSKTLQKYHSLLWSKKLPCGDIMNLTAGTGSDYLTYKNFRFGSDSITASFRYKKYRYMIDKVANALPCYKSYVENYLHNTYTIGGMIIFPKRMGGINQSRGCNSKIRDRWDLTLECIRLYYNNQKSPLYDVLIKEKEFFDLFVNFKGYVDFFFLQDCVSATYDSVLFWEGNGIFVDDPFPKSAESYLCFIENELEFVKNRNQRINEYIKNIDKLK